MIIDKYYRLLQNPIVSPVIASILETDIDRKVIISICDDNDPNKTYDFPKILLVIIYLDLQNINRTESWKYNPPICFIFFFGSR